jgi:membrane associated rhomboid family serine protease
MARFQTCPKCRALLEPGTRECPYCDANQAAARAPTPTQDHEATSRVGLWIVGVCVALYILMVVLDPGRGDKGEGNQLSASRIGYITFGMHETFLVRHCGQYWRLVTANFVHLGVFHLIMNCAALAMVVALAGGTLGADRTWVLFLATGVVATTASSLYGQSGAGASGGLCGLIGALAVYGHRRGGLEGRMLQKRMLTWAAVILVLGFIPGPWGRIDNVAHGMGFVSGAALGWLASAARAWGSRADRMWRAAGVFGLALVILVAGVFLVPNVLRSRERHDVKVFNGEVQRTLVALSLARDTDRLPKPIEEAPADGEQVRDAVNHALELARSGAPAAQLDLARRKADDEWRVWQERVMCSHAIGFAGS